MIHAPSPSSSTLSPLAPPFTVDRTGGDHRLQTYRYPPPPPVTEFNGDEPSPAKSSAESSSWMDPSISYNVSAFRRGGNTESFMAYGDAYGAWHGKHANSSSRQVHIGADSSAWLDKHPAIYEDNSREPHNNGMSYFQLPGPNLAMNECDASNSYDRYMAQLVSCSADSRVYYPSSTCSSSPEVFIPSNETSSSLYFGPRNCYPTPQHGDLLYNVDDNYVDYMLGNKKERGIDPCSDGGDGFVKGDMTHDKMEEYNGTGTYSIAAACSSLSNEVSGRNSMDHSAEIKCGFWTKQLNFTDSVASSSRPISSLQVSSEPHLAVDSPCWKGATVSQQYSFGSADMIGPDQEVKESNSTDDRGPGQKYLPVSDQYLRTSPFPEKDGDCHARAPLLFAGDFSPNLGPYGTDRKYNGVNSKGSESAVIEKEKIGHFSCEICERKNEEKESELVNVNARQSSEVRTANVTLPAESSLPEGEEIRARTAATNATFEKPFDLNLDAGSHVKNFSVHVAVPGNLAETVDAADSKHKSLTAGRDIGLLLKAMHGLSEVLLSSYNECVEWKECDDQLVQQLTDNLESFISRKKKGNSKGSSPPPGNEQGPTEVSISKFNGIVNKWSNTDTKDGEGMFHYTGPCMNGNEYNIGRSDGKKQVSVKDLENDVFAKKEDGPQAVLYKSLWMQAEASLCSMKYELARLKLEMENFNCQKKEKEHVQLIGSPKSTCIQGFDVPVLLMQESKCNDAGKGSEAKPTEPRTNRDAKVDASVMARLEVLKTRYARSDNTSTSTEARYARSDNTSTSTEEQPKRSDAENTFRDLSTKLADLGFVESATPQPFDADGNRGALPSFLEGMSADVPAPGYSAESGAFHPEISGDLFGGMPLVRFADGSLPQPFMPLIGDQRNPMRYILG